MAINKFYLRILSDIENRQKRYTGTSDFLPQKSIHFKYQLIEIY
jgi:hypothetical protein